MDKKQRSMVYASVVFVVFMIFNTLATPMVEEQQQLITQIGAIANEYRKK